MNAVLPRLAAEAAASPAADDAMRREALGLLQIGRGSEALQVMERAVELAPLDARNFLLAGLALQALGRHGAALAYLARAVTLNGSIPEALNAQGLSHMHLQQFAEAEQALRRVTVQSPGWWRGWFNLGLNFQRQSRHAESGSCFQRAAELSPEEAEPRSALGTAFLFQRRPADAEANCRAALARRPNFVEAMANLGLALREQNRLEEARATYDEALALEPEHAQLRWNMALVDLLRGDFAAGWTGFETRWRVPGFPSSPRGFAQPLWRGEPLAGRRLLLHAEQGFGDTIQMLRYLPAIAAMGGEVVLEVQGPLLPLAQAMMPPGMNLVARGDTLPAFDLHCPLMSLPMAFATRPDTIPLTEGYLRLPEGVAARWAQRLPRQAGRPRVGLVWAGRPTHSNDANRSLPSGFLAPLLALKGLDFVSLQVGPRAVEVNSPDFAGRVEDLSADLTDFLQTAGAVSRCDLVLGVDTSVVHLAGALGTPCLVMLPFAPDWRWMLGRDDSPWYSSLRLTRQRWAGDWARPIEDAVLRCRDLMHPTGP